MTEVFFSYLFKLNRKSKYLISVFFDGITLSICFFLAMFFRLDSFDFIYESVYWRQCAIVVLITLFLLAMSGFYKTVMRYVSSRSLRLLLVILVVSSTSLYVFGWILDAKLPRSVPILYLLLSFVVISGSRFFIRSINRMIQIRYKKPIIIYGAGKLGHQLLSALRDGDEYHPVAFVDDAKHAQGATVAGIKVYSPSKLPELIHNKEIELVLVAVPDTILDQRKHIIELLESLNVQVQTIPSISDLLSGRATISQLKRVTIEDLLGRDPVTPIFELMHAKISNKSIMVSGAGGSIGSELCRQLVRLGPKRLLLLESSEFNLYSIHQDLLHITQAEKLEVNILPLLGNVQNQKHIENIMKKIHIDTIFHAAAYKHVPLVEYNIIEGIRNNVFGTLALAKAAIDANVNSFILVSTDKAVRPTNIMGASKRMAELICQAFAREQSDTLFSMVRFGNVLGSSGSVIPLFQSQINAGGPITVTHKDITRYFMMIPEAAQLVIQAGSMAAGGDVFLLDMGEPVKILDLAIRMARLSGLDPIVIDEDFNDHSTTFSDKVIKIMISKLRPGEKLYEELLIGEDAITTQHPRILASKEQSLSWYELKPFLDDLEKACDQTLVSEIREILQRAPTGFQPTSNIADLTENSPIA